jgi:putative membrane protein
MRLSPVSVPYRAVRRGASLIVALAFATASGMGGLPGVGTLLVGVGVLIVLALLVAYEVAYYRRFEYDLTADGLEVRSGVVARREREIPIGRVQNLDVRRNVVERLLGVAAVSVETAGGGQTEASLRYVDYTEAKRLQRELARLKRAENGTDGETGVEGGGVDPRAEPDAETLFALSGRELVVLGALSFDLRLPGLGLLFLSGSVPFLGSVLPPLDPRSPPDLGVLLAGIGGLLLLAWVIGGTVQALNYYGFRLSRVGDELQYERGALRRFDGSIPLDKIQTLTVEDTPLKRVLGYATLRIETAGYTPGQGESGTDAATAVPIARRGRVYDLANDLEPFGDPDFERPPRRVRRRYLTRYGLAVGGLTAGLYALAQFVALPVSVPPIGRAIPWYLPLAAVPALPVAAHLKWTHRGYWLGPGHVITRNGVLRRRVKVVPYYRIQTVIDSRSPFQRRWRLATVAVDTAGSLSILGAGAAAVDVDRGTADVLREELDERLRTALARRRAGRRPAVGPANRAGARGARGPDATGEVSATGGIGAEPATDTDTGTGTEPVDPDDDGDSAAGARTPPGPTDTEEEPLDETGPWSDWQTGVTGGDGADEGDDTEDQTGSDADRATSTGDLEAGSDASDAAGDGSGPERGDRDSANPSTDTE